MGLVAGIASYGSTNNYVTLSANNTEYIRLLTSGNVGIGTTTSATKLHVEGDMTVATLATAVSGDSPVYADSTGKLKKGAALEPTFIDVSGAAGQVIGAAFTTVIMTTENSDPNGHHNTATGIYTVPSSGLYQITGTFRVQDGSTVGRQFGVGVHTSNIDGYWFYWHAVQNTTVAADRTTYPYIRVGRFTAGDQLRMFSYADGGNVTILLTGMQIIKIGE